MTGEIQSGKTSLCLEIVEHARLRGYRLEGLISPGVFQDGQKIAIDLEDIKTGERRRLAERIEERPTELQTRRWAFIPEIAAWGNQVLERVQPCDLLLIDELGPLEFHRDQGWTAGFKAVARGDYQAALLVIRPSLLEDALNRWDDASVIDLDLPSKSFRSAETLLPYLLEK